MTHRIGGFPTGVLSQFEGAALSLTLLSLSLPLSLLSYLMGVFC